MSLKINSGFGINASGSTGINKNSEQYKAVERDSMAKIFQLTPWMGLRENL